MMARAKTLRAEQKQRVKEVETTKKMTPKARRKASRERRAYFREKFARSGSRLIKLQQEDPDSFYIGFVGANRSGRGDALKAVEVFLKRATELKASIVHTLADISVIHTSKYFDVYCNVLVLP